MLLNLLHETTQADRQKAEAAEVAQRAAEEESARMAAEAAAAVAEAADAERLRAETLAAKAERLPPEPAAFGADVVQVLIRMPGGQRLNRRRAAAAHMFHGWHWLMRWLYKGVLHIVLFLHTARHSWGTTSKASQLLCMQTQSSSINILCSVRLACGFAIHPAAAVLGNVLLSCAQVPVTGLLLFAYTCVPVLRPGS